jgi:hypothetical protein
MLRMQRKDSTSFGASLEVNGADKDVLLRIHNSAVLSALWYGVTAYGSATKKKLEELEPMHNAGLRISIGEYHCTARISGILTKIREKTVAMTGIRIRTPVARTLKRSNAALRILMPHLPAPLEVCVEHSLYSYGLQDNIIHPNIE